MQTDYDKIAESYKRSKQIPWRYHIEEYSLRSLLGDVSQASVLDLACGDGHYTRVLKRMGTSRTVGVDLSAKMIDLAAADEKVNRLGIEYVVGDARAVRFDEQFDLVVAAYLLPYARSEEELLAMAKAIHSSLKPGGRFVAANNNPAQQPEAFERTRKYGFVKSADGQIRNGSPIRYTFLQESGEFVVENYHLDAETHTRTFEAAGFSDVHWHLPELAPAESANGDEYWKDFLDDPPIAFLTCAKSEVSAQIHALGR